MLVFPPKMSRHGKMWIERECMGTLTKKWTRIFEVAAIAVLACSQGMAQTAPAADSDHSFNVSTTQPWTDTGLDLQTGDVLDITASGTQCDPQGVGGASIQGL